MIVETLRWCRHKFEEYGYCLFSTYTLLLHLLLIHHCFPAGNCKSIRKCLAVNSVSNKKPNMDKNQHNLLTNNVIRLQFDIFIIIIEMFIETKRD